MTAFGQKRTFTPNVFYMQHPLSESSAELLIRHYAKYVEPTPWGLSCYDSWIAGEEEVSPGISPFIGKVAACLLNSDDSSVRLSAIQALACAGQDGDIAVLETAKEEQGRMHDEFNAAIAHLRQRMKSVDDLLNEVIDRNSFVLFARALAEERERAAKVEAQDPVGYQINGALGWNNSDIPSFIYQGLSAFEGRQDDRLPSWADFADFLYRGKTLE